ncbi:translation initiation factor IF-2 N-terminal domain-containing protein [Georgenia satyanarayanai]|uniref:translation initiation factor IF-2 N-terminal domain-containing protein n=1 Tax=Georgenia satyanarayanai TaxID=860221 RepID=UPI000DA21C0D|nr:translation initiation factor IF-2 N-terminal domain-containing protein [Georgenia satyanarayanai]
MRIRVHELARELGVSSPRILAELGKMGEFVKSASSVLDAKVAAAVRSSLNSATAPPSRRNPFTFNVPATPRPASSSRALSTQSCWGDDYWDDPPRPREAELTAAEAALELGVRPSTVRQWVRRGHLTSSGVRVALGSRTARTSAPSVSPRRSGPDGAGSAQSALSHG